MKQLLIICTMLCSLAVAQDAATASRLKQYNLAGGSLAIEGYDPVAYFINNKAVKGKASNTASFKGVTYHFANTANQQAFQKDPQKYEPQYGGWCAYAMGNDGSKVEVDPETFRIKDGKLYLFYNSFFNNTMKTWLKAEPDLQKKADANWPKFYKP